MRAKIYLLGGRYFHKHTRIQTLSSLHFFAPFSSVRPLRGSNDERQLFFFAAAISSTCNFYSSPLFSNCCRLWKCTCMCAFKNGWRVSLSFIISSFHFASLRWNTRSVVYILKRWRPRNQFETDGNECGFFLCSYFEICLHSYVSCVCFTASLGNANFTLRTRPFYTEENENKRLKNRKRDIKSKTNFNQF